MKKRIVKIAEGMCYTFIVVETSSTDEDIVKFIQDMNEDASDFYDLIEEYDINILFDSEIDDSSKLDGLKIEKTFDIMDY